MKNYTHKKQQLKISHVTLFQIHSCNSHTQNREGITFYKNKPVYLL